MLNLRGQQRVCIVGGGTAGWFAALHLRQLFSPSVEILLISAPEVPIVGVGEGGILNLMEALHRLKIPFGEFMQETEAVHKLGFVYEGWRDHQLNPKDFFYHMFPVQNDGVFGNEQGYFPTLSALLNHDIPISYVVDSIKLREKNLSQDTLTQMLMTDEKHNFASSFHFDTYKVGHYLRKIALQRGVIHQEGMFK